MKQTPDTTRKESARTTFGLHPIHQGSCGVPLPLKAVDARFEVAGDCAQIAIEQIFEFNGPNPADVLYTFPLPEDASIHRCQLRVGNRVVEAVAKPTVDARQDFEHAHAAGHRVAIIETLRENLFELQLGNVQPGDAVTIFISYTAALRGEGHSRRLRIPTCPGVRFIPGQPVGVDGATDLVPDAGRLNPLRINPADQAAAVFYCAGTLIGATDIQSASYEIEVLPPASDGRIGILPSKDSDTPDRDYILTWETCGEPLALSSNDDPEYLLCSIQAPDDLPLQRGARDIFLLLDASGSMEGANWTALVDAVELALAGLAPTDRVAVDLFANNLAPITRGLIPVNTPNAVQISRQLRTHKPDGGTEFTAAFRTIISHAGDTRRPVIIVITDGQFGDEARACAVAIASGIEIHTIGIDANVNEAVLRKIARRTRGTCSLCVPGEDLTVTMRQLISHLVSPAIDRISAGTDWTLVGNPPALRPGQSAVVPFRRTAIGAVSPLEHIDFNLRFTDHSERSLRLPIRAVTGRAPALLAAKAEITAMLDADQPSAAVAVACRFNLLCEGTAFVAVDTAEKVAVAAALLEQPSLEPHALLGSPSARFRRQSSVRRDSAAHTTFFCRTTVNDAPSHFPEARSFGGLLRSPAPDVGRKVGGMFKKLLGSVPSAPSPQADKTDDNAAAFECRAWAEAVVCFDRVAWLELFERFLLPWAVEHPRNHRLLLRLLRDLSADSIGSDLAATGHRALHALIPFLPPVPAQAVIRFSAPGTH